MNRNALLSALCAVHHVNESVLSAVFKLKQKQIGKNAIVWKPKHKCPWGEAGYEQIVHWPDDFYLFFCWRFGVKEDSYVVKIFTLFAIKPFIERLEQQHIHSPWIMFKWRILDYFQWNIKHWVDSIRTRA